MDFMKQNLKKTLLEDSYRLSQSLGGSTAAFKERSSRQDSEKMQQQQLLLQHRSATDEKEAEEGVDHARDQAANAAQLAHAAAIEKMKQEQVARKMIDATYLGTRPSGQLSGSGNDKQSTEAAPNRCMARGDANA